MSQARYQSAVEATANVATGYVIALLTQIVVFPWFHVHTSMGQNLGIAAAFTGVSWTRSFVLRRLFNRMLRAKPSEAA